jgi:4,5-DOPA dioxygenase extradiol
MPVAFVGHGSPMNAIEDGEFRRGWAEVARRIPAPRAVLCVSAHWETAGVSVTAAERPATIHDFAGFPRELFEVRYPAPGDPLLARETAEILGAAGVVLDAGRGLDHGCWSVLRAMYPRADVPVVQLSLDTRRPGSFHYRLAQGLAPLRRRGVLVVGSGDVVHNLGLADFRRPDGYGWAVRFDDQVVERIEARDHGALVDYSSLPDARLAVPTPEHYLPLLYVLALRDEAEPVAFFNRKTVLGSISMTSLTIGAPVSAASLTTAAGGG